MIGSELSVMLNALGRLLTNGDAAELASYFECPLPVYFDDKFVLFHSSEKMAEAITAYWLEVARSQIRRVAPVLLRVEDMTPQSLPVRGPLELSVGRRRVQILQCRALRRAARRGRLHDADRVGGVSGNRHRGFSDFNRRGRDWLKRRSDVIGIFPNDDAIVRLVGALMLESNDEAFNRRNEPVSVKRVKDFIWPKKGFIRGWKYVDPSLAHKHHSTWHRCGVRLGWAQGAVSSRTVGPYNQNFDRTDFQPEKRPGSHQLLRQSRQRR